jgi:hypothetical protein
MGIEIDVVGVGKSVVRCWLGLAAAIDRGGAPLTLRSLFGFKGNGCGGPHSFSGSENGKMGGGGGSEYTYALVNWGNAVHRHC